MTLKNCRITAVRFSDAGSSFCILEAVHGLQHIKIKGSFDRDRATGKPVVLGKRIDMTGRWSDHAVYGKSFECEFWTEARPDSVKEMEKYLAARFVKGVGPYVAKNIISAFGKDSFRILDEEPDRLLGVKGIGPVKLEWIRQTWEKESLRRRALMFFTTLDLPKGTAERIFKRYGVLSEEVIKKEPYRMVTEIEGLGFKKADAIALGAGIQKDDPMRIRAGLVQALVCNRDDDRNTCLEKGLLINRAGKLLEVGAALIRPVLREAIKDKDILIKDGMACLPADYSMEELCADILLKLARQPAELIDVDFEGGDIEYSPEQKQAVLAAMDNSVMVLTGGPGTGKTTTTRKIIEGLREAGLKVALAAPTGKAARRASESTGFKATTIHVLLGFNRDHFERGPHSRLPQDAVVVDEFSMVDVSLFASLLTALKPGARLVMIGDKDQLPSVGPGCVLRDIIRSGAVKTINLTRIFRQAEGSAIIKNAHKIMEGRCDFVQGDDFVLAGTRDKQKAADYIRDCVCEHIPRVFGIPPTQIQVLCPQKSELLGTESLNLMIRERLNPRGKEFKAPSGSFRLGDRVMQTRNDYKKMVFNGEVGYITRVDRDSCQIQFDGRTAAYTREEMQDVILAYAATVHKSQGSEYRVVIMPLCSDHRYMLYKNLFYTGVTRAQQLFLLVDIDGMSGYAVSREESETRKTLLADLLRQKNKRKEA